MRVYISADMEGVTGVTHPEDVIPGRSQYERFRHLLTGDVNAAIEGAAGAGAASFLVNEAHDGMRNLLLKDLASQGGTDLGPGEASGHDGGHRGLRRRLSTPPPTGCSWAS